MSELGPLSIDVNILKDRTGQIVAIVLAHDGHARAKAYAHVFAASVDLLRIMEDIVLQTVAYDRDKNESLPEWLKDSVRAIARARGNG